MTTYVRNIPSDATVSKLIVQLKELQQGKNEILLSLILSYKLKTREARDYYRRLVESYSRNR